MKPGKLISEVTDAIKSAVVITYEKDTPGELDVMHYIAENGFETMASVWFPTEDEIRAIINGRGVQVHIVGTRQPWMKVEVAT